MHTPLRPGLRLLSVASLKGGVGKSTTAMMLAETFAVKHNIRVLVVDLDPQASCSQMLLGVDGLRAAAQSGRTMTGYVDLVASGRPRTLASHIVGPTRHSRSAYKSSDSRGASSREIAILPATPGLRFAELEYDYRNHSGTDAHAPRKRMAEELRKDLAAVGGRYDAVIFDCPPAFSTLAQAAISLSDAILSPMLEEPLSLWSLQAFCDFGLQRTLGAWSPARHRILFTRVQSRGSIKERSDLRQSLVASGYRALSSSIPETGQSYRWVRSAGSDSPASFALKYGRIRSSVEALGDETLRWMGALPRRLETENTDDADGIVREPQIAGRR